MINEEIKINGRSIFLVGSNHSDDYAQLELIRSSLEKFGPDIVLVEGNFNKASFDSIEESIKYGKEMGYISFICRDKNIPMESNDPPFEEDKQFVEQEYNIEIKDLYFTLRDFVSKKIIENDRIKILFKKVLNEKFDISKNYFNYFNPTMSLNIFNQVTRKLNDFRDNYMICKISELLKKYSKIFIIKGDYHLITNFKKIKEIIDDS